MTNCYNQGIAHLKKQLGVKNNSYDITKIVNRSSEHYIHLLLGQYYLGQSAKDELFSVLTDLGYEDLTK